MPARLFLRWIANFVDGVVVVLLVSAGTVILMFTPVAVFGSRSGDAAIIPALVGIGLMLVGVVYSLTRDGNDRGAGVGKGMVGICVVDYASRQACGRGRAFGRNLLTLLFNLTVIPALVDLVVAIASAEKRRIVDMLAGTIVVSADRTGLTQRVPGYAQPYAPPTPYMPVPQYAPPPPPTPQYAPPPSPYAAPPTGANWKTDPTTRMPTGGGSGSESTMRLSPAFFEVVGGPGVGQVLRIPRDKNGTFETVIGRGQEVMPGFVGLPSRMVSRKQARLAQSGAAWMIENLSDTNPTIVGGKSLGGIGERSALQDGSSVVIGDVSLRFRTGM